MKEIKFKNFILEVKGCPDCPFAGESGPYGETWNVCKATKNSCGDYESIINFMYNNIGKYPQFCPLEET
jgi:hypothetical protein